MAGAPECGNDLMAVSIDPPGGDWAATDVQILEVIDRKLLSGAVTAVWHGDAVARASAVGVEDVRHSKPMAMDTIFRLFSMTKPVTAVAMMILWDEGKWSPADPLAKHLPELADLRVSRSAQECTDEPEVAATQPTLEHLMTHQAGFSYGFTDDPIDRAYRAAGLPILPHDITAQEYLSRLAGVPLAYEPGTGWRYSVAMDVQGIFIERLSGMTLRDFMHERIFEPLGMVDTDFAVPTGKIDRLAALYTLAEDQLAELTGGVGDTHDDNLAAVSFGDFVLPHDRQPILASGGGGLFSTALDYLHFGRMLLGRGELEGRRILSREAVAMMTTSHTAHLLGDGFGTSPHWLRPGYEYAFNGIAVTDPQAADVALGRNSYLWDGAAGSWFWVDPTNDLVFVCMVHLLNDAERLSLQFRSRNVVADILSARAGIVGAS